MRRELARWDNTALMTQGRVRLFEPYRSLCQSARQRLFFGLVMAGVLSVSTSVTQGLLQPSAPVFLAMVSLIATLYLFLYAIAAGFQAATFVGGQRACGQLEAISLTSRGLRSWLSLVFLWCFLPSAVCILILAIWLWLAPPPYSASTIYTPILVASLRGYTLALAGISLLWAATLTIWGLVLGVRSSRPEAALQAAAGTTVVGLLILTAFLWFVRTFREGPGLTITFNLGLPVWTLAWIGIAGFFAGCAIAWQWTRRLE